MSRIERYSARRARSWPIALLVALWLGGVSTACQKQEPSQKTKKELHVELNRKVVRIDKALAAWVDDWTLRVYAVAGCKAFRCGTHVDAFGHLTRAFRKECPNYRIYGVEFRAANGVRMQTGTWRHGEKNPTVNARPFIASPKTPLDGLFFAKGGTIQLMKLSPREVSFNANFKDANKSTYGAQLVAPICPSARKPGALTSRRTVPHPLSPVLTKAELQKLAPKLPTHGTDWQWKALTLEDGEAIWILVNKKTKHEAGSLRVLDVRNRLHMRTKRVRLCLGRFPCARRSNAWLWLHVGNFDINADVQHSRDKSFQSDAGLRTLLRLLPLETYLTK